MKHQQLQGPAYPFVFIGLLTSKSFNKSCASFEVKNSQQKANLLGTRCWFMRGERNNSAQKMYLVQELY